MVLTKAKYRLVKQCGIWLRCTFSTRYPVAIAFEDDLDGDFGACQIQHKKGTDRWRFLIQLKTSMEPQLLLETLWHEWAHALTMTDLMVGEDGHSDRFYSVYGQIERAWNAGGHIAAQRLEV